MTPAQTKSSLSLSLSLSASLFQTISPFEQGLGVIVSFLFPF